MKKRVEAIIEKHKFQFKKELCAEGQYTDKLGKTITCVPRSMDAEEYTDFLDRCAVEILEAVGEHDVKENMWWFIWSNEHHAWWKSNHRGYSQDKNEAGLYSTEDAMKIVKGANEHQFADQVPNEAMIPQFDHKHIDDGE